jgi:hypothetical protein
MSVLAAVSASALAQVQPFEDGFYHARNVGTTRWITMRDNYSSGLNTRTTTYDVSALCTFRSYSNIVSDPGSVVYVAKYGQGYNLYAQGTDVLSFTNGFVVYLANAAVENAYILYSRYSGVEAHLNDASSFREEGAVSTTYNANYPQNEFWYIDPVSQEDEQYFGVTPTVQIGSDYYQTLYTWFGYTFYSEGMSAWYVKRVTDDGYAIIAPVEGTQVHGATPVIIRCSGADASANRLTPIYDTEAGPADNQLHGVYFCHDQGRLGLQIEGPHRVVTTFDPATMRLLGKTADGRLAFVNGTEWAKNSYDSEKNTTYYLVPANTCYLSVSEDTPAELPVLTEQEYIDLAVTSVKADAAVDTKGVFTLSGQRLNATGQTDGLPAGIYVVNGRKQVVR